MAKPNLHITPANTSKLLVVLPNWVGDVVLATPTLRAIRESYPDAHIGYVMRPYVSEVLQPCGWCDEVFYWSGSKNKARQQHDFLRLAGEIRKRKYEVALLLSNSFRAALLAKLARVKIRIGYNRDGRALLLTVKMLPDRLEGKFMPVSMVRYYAGLARYLGCNVDENRLELGVHEDDQRKADALLAAGGIGENDKFAAIVPGAAYGSAKCWPPSHFGALIDMLADRTGLKSVVACGPGEREIGMRIRQAARQDAAVVLEEPAGLGPLKALIGRTDLLVTNDTGPRHFAKAFGKPVVTVFGSSEPRWTDTVYPMERKVRVDVPCGPCMLKRCPLDHRCMNLVTAEMVCEQALDLLGTQQGTIQT